jgi:nickel/cobalt transporter (NicO) family protein
LAGDFLMLETLVAIQRWIYSTIGSELTGFATSKNWWALATILPIGIVFGAIHALTPGHGKTVLASYLIGSRLPRLRSLAVAGALALTHVASAVVLALLAAPLVARTLGGAGRAPVLEGVSHGLLALVGVWLLYRAFRGNSAHPRHEGVMVGVIAGLIPCPLTLFVMFFAIARGVVEAGLTFALAMMLGVAITLSTVAIFAILARDWTVQFLSRHGLIAGQLMRYFDAAAGLLLISIGLSEFLRR